MPFIDTNQLKVKEPVPGWKGRYFHSDNLTFGHYTVEARASINERLCLLLPITLVIGLLFAISETVTAQVLQPNYVNDFTGKPRVQRFARADFVPARYLECPLHPQ